MTAEIAIINRHAVALAADSAVTIGRDRVWKHANKIFSLGPQHDIGVMIYNAGDFLGIPWEVIIKQFRIECDKKRFATVSECLDCFTGHLMNMACPNEELEELSITLVFVDFLETLVGGLEFSNKAEMISAISERIKTFIERADETQDLDSALSQKNFNSRYKKVIKELCYDKDTFAYHPDSATLKLIYEMCYLMLKKQFRSGYSTGGVFAGFGESQMLPCIHECTIDGRHNGFIRCWMPGSINLNGKNAPAAAISPFGQIDIAFFFIEGIIAKYLDVIERLLTGIFDEKSSNLVNDYIKDQDESIVELGRQKRDNEIIIRKFMEVFERIRRDTMVEPLLDVITPLPKEEMATLAEALVELTSLRRKLEPSLDTVSGPIDVAVISKGDGFIWIKRKHYFSIEMNNDFLYRKKLRLGGRRYENADGELKKL